jgi:hypothetical protein
VLLYRIWPQVIDAMVLVKPRTVVQWHRRGFRLFWRWRSRRPGRPRISTEIRALIRRMSRANPLWGAPRIHGELLKLGIKVSQATDCLTARIYSSFPERCGHRLALGDGRGRCLCRVGPGNFTPSLSQIRT